MLQGRPLVFLDVETTGLGPWNSRILEIGALRLEGGKVIATYNQVLDPQEPVPPFITRLTGITGDETAGQPRFVEVMPRLQELFQDAVFVAHNVDFDYSFFRAEFARLGQRFAMDKLCTVRLSRTLFPGERSHRLDEVIRRGGYRVANRHRAFDDASVLHRFYQDNLQRLGAAEFYKLAERLVWPGARQQFM
jgi:DNA polymerase-3 subunit epsilon